MSVKVSLFAELERVFDSKERALHCAISHGQVTVDDYVVKLGDDWRWTLGQLGGRLAKVNGREGRLFGMSPRCRTPTTPDVATGTTE